MSGPILLDIGRFKSVLHGISLSDSWRISSSKSDDVIWNIVLAYLNSFPLANEDELTQRIECLTGHQMVNENIRKSVQMCNPFFRRNACYSDKVMSELVSAFKDRVEDYIKRHEKEFQSNANNFRYLESSSKLLSCNIVLLSFSFRDKIAVTVFPIQASSKSRTIYPKHILIHDKLIFTSRNGIPQENFAFCIPKEIGIQKQRETLKEILERTRMLDNNQKMIQKVCILPDITENFLLSLLKNNLWKVLTFIYESPNTLLKLADAGFETDPRTKDSEGKSAFFHALKTEESHLMSLLYDHAANACLQTDTSVRSPDSVIVENLRCLKDYLKLMEKDLESAEITEKSRCLFRGLCRFNEFQIEMCKNINSFHSKVNYYDYTKKEYEISKRKETLLLILNIYKTYSDYTSGESKSSLEADDNISRFKEFYKHKDYFDKLDFSSAVMFFDNLFLLKEKLLLPNEAYLDIERNFFLFIFSRKYLERYEKENYLVARWITFQERLSLQRQICMFKAILEKTEQSKNNIVYNIPETAVRTLTNLPQINGQFLIFRLQHYLNAATGLTVKDLKSILVIERCLQVLGDCCQESTLNFAQRMISAALPTEFVILLTQICNRLSYIKSDALLSRNILEQDVELFLEIRNELAKLKKILLPIYSIRKYEMDRLLLLHTENSVSDIRGRSISEKHENQLKAILPSLESEEIQLSVPTSSCQYPWKSYFDYLQTSLKDEVIEINSNSNILEKHTSSRYKYIIQNMISAAEVVLKYLKVPIPEKAVTELDSHFRCLESILSYVTKDRILHKHRKTLKLMLKNRKSFFTEWRKYKPTNSITDETPVAQGESVRKHLTTELEDTCDNKKQTMKPIDTSDCPVNMEPKSSTFLNSAKDTKEYTGVADLSGNIEKITNTERNVFFSSASLDDWIKANVYHNYPFNDETKDPGDIKNVKRENVIKYSRRLLYGYEKFAGIIDQHFPCDSNEEFHFKNIEKFCLLLKGRTFLNDNEKEFILQSVPKEFKNIFELKGKVKASLKRETNFMEEKETELFKLNLQNREIKEIKIITEMGLNEESYRIMDKAGYYLLELKKKMELSEISRGEYEWLCEKLRIPDDAKNILSKIVSGQIEKGPGNQFEFLRNRIKMLKNILIYENSAIQQLWESADTPRKKKHVKEKIVQLYLNDFEIQASVEMLLFDCMNILSSKELKNLWESTTNLFSGINLRNVLAHSYSLSEEFGYSYYPSYPYYHPNHFLSELVEKMVKLIADEYVIDCMQQILEQSGTNFSGFMQIMNDEENKQFKNLREQILECDHWKRYALLIHF